MCITRAIVVHRMKFSELSNFAASFEFTSDAWSRFYGRHDGEKFSIETQHKHIPYSSEEIHHLINNALSEQTKTNTLVHRYPSVAHLGSLASFNLSHTVGVSSPSLLSLLNNHSRLPLEPAMIPPSNTTPKKEVSPSSTPSSSPTYWERRIRSVHELNDIYSDVDDPFDFYQEDYQSNLSLEPDVLIEKIKDKVSK
jgi:hypothetical protein